jgi:hypothetical protein
MNRFEYFHVELDRHEMIFAEDVAAETYLDTGNRSGFASFDHADCGVQDAALAARRNGILLAPGDVALGGIRAGIAGRFGRFGVTLTDLPDLHLLADGRPMRPDAAWGGVYRFHLPQAPRSLRLRSRSAVPAVVLPESTDCRRLGVALSRITLVSGDAVIALDRSLGGLGQGFHAMEHGFCWTDGDAALPEALLAGLSGPVSIEIEVRQAMRYPVTASEAGRREVA